MPFTILLTHVDLGSDTEQDVNVNSPRVHTQAQPPLGLLYLASAVRKSFSDVNVEVFNTEVADFPIRQFTEFIRKHQPQIIGLRSLSVAKKSFSKFAEVAKEANPDASVVGGGPYTTSSYEELLTAGTIDLAVLGEGENTFTELVDHVRKHDALPDQLDGTAVLDGADVNVNAPRPPVQDLDSIPFPDYDHVDLNEYRGKYDQTLMQEASESALICSSRGCPYQCVYCHNIFGKKVRRRSPKNLVEEMKRHVEIRGITKFSFVDDIFNVPKRVAKETLAMIDDQLPPVRLNFPNGLRVDQLDDELMDLLEKAGAVYFALAVETATPRLQKLIRKNLDLEKADEYISKCAQRFLLRLNFMIGFPTETYQEATRTVEFAERHKNATEPVMSIVRVFNNTPLADMLAPNEKQKRLLDNQEGKLYAPKLFGGDLSFYGDFFDDEKAPMSGRDIHKLRIKFTKDVLNDKQRINHTHDLLEKHVEQREKMAFYRNFYDNPNFDENNLRQLLAG